MQTEKQKMLAGELYDPTDTELVAERERARRLFKQVNDTGVDDRGERLRLVRELIPDAGANLWIEPPFYCDYGTNIAVGDNVFFNFNCVVLDVLSVRIGSRTLIGSGVQILTATHPISAKQRSTGLEFGRPIEIGDDVWIGGGAIICPGVSVGNRTVIGAGSVVTKSLPDGVVAVGNPCRVTRRVDD